MDRFAELRAFCLVANSGGFSAAARELGVATSSVARLVDGLEQRLGTPLLNRSTRSVTLTDSGRAYHARAVEILAALEEADDGAAGRGAAHGMLRVAAPVTFATMYIAPLLPELMRRHPRLELDLRLNETFANLVDESIDVAIRIGSGEQQSSLIARKLAVHRRSICASPAYVQLHGRPRTPADLLGHNCMQFSYGARTHDWRLQAHGRTEQVAVRGNVSVNNAEVLRRAALDGMGLVMLADWLVQDDINAGRLVRLLEGYQANPGDMEVGIYAVYQASRRGSGKIMALVDLLAQSLNGESVA